MAWHAPSPVNATFLLLPVRMAALSASSEPMPLSALVNRNPCVPAVAHEMSMPSTRGSLPMNPLM